VRAYGTKEIARIRDGFAVLPWTAPLFLLMVLALSGFPPSGLFRSEFQIVAGGLASSRHAGAVLLVALVCLAFLGLAVATARMVLAPGATPSAHGEQSYWMVTPVLVCFAALVLLGVHPPGPLADLLAIGARQLSGGAP
jgi:hydrogenase-4 component F